jgi:hypothetical protein
MPVKALVLAAQTSANKPAAPGCPGRSRRGALTVLYAI